MGYEMFKLIFLLFVFGCASGSDKIANSKALKYRLTMDTGHGKGMIALDIKSSYQFNFEWKDKAELIKITTCHREKVIEANRIFRSKKDYNWKYVPTEIEISGMCPIFVGAYDTKGQHSWAYIDFRLPSETLEATVDCSGSSKKSKGLSVCQSRKGLTQRISFTDKVLSDSSMGCNSLNEMNNNIFELETQSGICHYVFTEIKSKKIHRLTMYGYDDVLLREFKIEVQ